MDERKRLIKNTGIIAIGNLSTRLVSFLLLPLYTSLLSTSEYGIVDYITSIAVFIVPFSTLLMDEALFRFLIDCKTEEEKQEVFSSSMVIASTGEIVFLVIITPIAVFSSFRYGLILLLYVTFSSLSMMLNAFLRGIGRTDQFALFNFLQGTLTIVLNVLFIVGLKMRAEGLLFSTIIAMGTVSLMFFCKFHVWRFVDLNKVKADNLKKVLKYSLPLIPNKVSWSIINVSDRLIIMNMINSSASGLYAVSYKFPNLMDTVYGFFYQSWKESSARVLGQGDQDAFYQDVYSYLRHFMFAIVLLMTACMPLIFRLLINKSFNEAILYVPILLLGTYYSNISGFFGGVFTAYKDTTIMGITTIIAAGCNVIVHFLLIKYVGLYAGAVSTLVSCYIVYLYRKIKVKKYVNFNEERIMKLISYLVLIIVLFCFYKGGTELTVCSMGIALVYSVLVNLRLIKIILKRVRAR